LTTIIDLKSPITGLPKVAHIRNVNCDDIIQGYKNQLDIDVSRFFSQKEIALYKCLDTGYCFYYPFTISGDSSFYKELQNIHWYYQDWKYEYAIAAQLIKNSDKVLEVGCGKGSFLKYLKGQNIDACGLELNEEVIMNTQFSDITIKNETIECHADENRSCYDWVVSFQVLEHISDIRSFIEASLATLKKTGKMIIAVPNNNTLYFSHYGPLSKNYDDHQRATLMNMPPHHMGLWDEKSLQKMADAFNLKLEYIYKEPLAQHRVGMVSEIVGKKISRGLGLDFIEPTLFKIIRKMRKYFSGDTIVAVYSKL
jgi:SAM-dependent methyltransferase